MMRSAIFLGPSRPDPIIGTHLEIFPPAALGSVYRAVEAGFRRIGIIDGYFGNAPSVWHKEVLYALSAGVEVFGASSMGALRAAELDRFGMIGVGLVYRLYRSGVLTDDDEVCLMHEGPESDYRPISYAMVNVRITLRRMRRLRLLDGCQESVVVRHVKRLHYSQRTGESIAEALRVAALSEQLLQEFFTSHYVDAKRLDAARLCALLCAPRPDSRSSNPVPCHFPSTLHWQKQFVEDLADVPPLGPDVHRM
jgi:hypothetical protein